MKVYVDRLPKGCEECPCFYDESISCQASDKWLPLDEEDNFSGSTQRHPNCPLQSLSDHAKQVRKDVIEKIRYSLLDFSHNYWKVFKQNGRQYMTDNDLRECLDEILDEIGEENVKN